MLKKPKFLSKSVRDQMQTECVKIRKLANELQDSPDQVAVLQNGVQSVLKECDPQTRTYIYRLVDTVLNAEVEAQKCLINPTIVLALEKYKHHMRTGIMTKQLLDHFMEQVQKLDNPHVTTEDIYQSIIMRLLMELPHDKITDILQHLAPAVAVEKESFNQRHMYG
jgi:hypothetical protein